MLSVGKLDQSTIDEFGVKLDEFVKWIATQPEMPQNIGES